MSWLELLKGLAVVVSVIVSIVALQRKKADVSRELYHRRLMVYLALMDFLRPIREQRRVDAERLHKLTDVARESSFLFDDCITEYLESIRRRSLQYQSDKEFAEKFGPIMTRSERKEISTRILGDSAWFLEQQKTAPRRFKKFMKLA